jgi:hypothetical protein
MQYSSFPPLLLHSAVTQIQVQDQFYWVDQPMCLNVMACGYFGDYSYHF